MGNQVSIVNSTQFPGPKRNYADIYNLLESKGVVAYDNTDDKKQHIVNVKLPEGWFMLDYDDRMTKIFYLFDDNRDVVIVMTERDVDKYRDYEREMYTLEQYLKYNKCHFTIPLPDFYIVKNQYASIDMESDFGKELNFVKEFDKKRTKYISKYDKMNDEEREEIERYLFDNRSRIKEIAKNTQYTIEYREYKTLLSDARDDRIYVGAKEIINNIYIMLLNFLAIKSSFENISEYEKIDNGRLIKTNLNKHLYFTEYCYIPKNKAELLVIDLESHPVHMMYNMSDEEILSHRTDFFCERYQLLTRHLDKYSEFVKLKKEIKYWYSKNKNFLKCGALTTDDFIIVGLENKENKEIEDKLNRLIRNYEITLSGVSGCGSRGQIYADSAYKEMYDFAKEHNMLDRIKGKYKINDDKTGGCSTGLSMGLSSFY